MRNKTKLKNITSKYIGVSFNKNRNKWISQININNNKLNKGYDNEHHAAYQYNIWCKEYNLTTANLNIIPEKYIKDFIQNKKFKKINNLPKNITLNNNKYRIKINGKHIGLYNTLFEAIITRNFKLREIENKKQDKIKKIPIKRNKEGQAIIEIYNKNKEKICETIIDDDFYYDLNKYANNINTNGYIQNYKLGLLHRYIINYTGDNYIDHINNNKLDNRKENLRIATVKQNSQNKSSKKKSTSKYIGVSFNTIKNKWVSQIYINNKNTFLGYFNNEEHAAKVRDIATKKYFGEYGNLNFKE